MESSPMLDPAILPALPSGTRVLKVQSHGKTNFAQGFKVEVDVDGKQEAYFLKTALSMARGEFESLVALQKYIPDNVPKPVALGPLQDGTITKCYFVVEFKDMLALKPSPQATASVLSRLHHMSESPNGKFGFPVTTYKGYFPVNNDWCDTWEAWFSREFAQTLRNYYLRRGEDCELVHLYSEFSDKIIPRLLRPLETGGRSIKPTLCHTDLWHGNAAVGRETQECIIFDPCCLYGHNEVDLGFFRTEKYGWNTAYIEEYAKLMQPSEPQADFDDRIAVYAMRNYIVSATLWDHWLHMMDHVKDEMRRLIAKYPDGFADVAES